jgi:hypothetical protein
MAYTGWAMAGAEEIWFPLVDEPIGSIVEQLQADDPAIAELVDTPRRLLAFRTFAYIRVGILAWPAARRKRRDGAQRDRDVG